MSNRCFACHGQDAAARQADVRLDERDSAVQPAPSGETPIVPKHPDQSEVWARVSTTDSSLRMPPEEAGAPLTDKELKILRTWIEQGAPYEPHWAFIAPARPETPDVRQSDWPRNEIDRFVLATLKRENLSPSPEASRAMLIRRVTLDLTGLPPTIAEIDQFLKDESANAYERVVDRLLASERYAEHQARHWLDLARYGDTHGLHGDYYFEMWPYRDWVIAAFDRNMPFDEFTVAQLAGDLVEDASDDDLVATGFLRCHVTTNEAGFLEEEAYVRNVVDRVETASTVWLGLTAGCAACHDHKYDPLTQKEFYSLFAFFNNGEDKPLNGKKASPAPSLARPSAEQSAQLASLRDRLAELGEQIASKVSPDDYQDPLENEDIQIAETDYVWIDDELPSEPTQKPIDDNHQWTFVSQDSHPVYSGARSSRLNSNRETQHLFHDERTGLMVGEGDSFFFWVFLDPKSPPRQIMFKANNGSWEHRAYWGENRLRRGVPNTSSRREVGKLPPVGQWVQLRVPAKDIGIQSGDIVYGVAISQDSGTAYYDSVGLTTRVPQDGSHLKSFHVWQALQLSYAEHPHLPDDVAVALQSQPRTDEESRLLKKYFLDNVHVKEDSAADAHNKARKQLQQQIERLEKAIPSATGFRERNSEKPAFVLNRGQYDQPGERAPRAVPAFLPDLPQAAPRDRLGLARWLVSPQHPLTARVTVNRIWQQHFGVGLVKTSEDFGVQGELPSHPELLDFLATEFIRSGWDMKRLHKRIVMSATYRQDSRASQDLLDRDPENRLLARGPRFRLDAEAIRDLALFAGGLLENELGGPPVKPYQPIGIWEAVSSPSSNTSVYEQDQGKSLYRRSMYTFWKRTAPPPTMLAFDAPSRETCVSRRSRTNTPLAALALLNDVQFVEAARAMAERVLLAPVKSDTDRIKYAFRLVTSRKPTQAEIDSLERALADHRAAYAGKRQEAVKLLEVGDSPRDESLNPIEHAAWSVLCNTLLNLSETITKN